MTPRLRQLNDDEVLVEVGSVRVVIPSACPHRKGRLRFGRVNVRTMRITCPLHYSTFDLLSGERVGGPACHALTVRVLPDDEEPPR
jgi:nitrite reductase/ring-hydroxylating ferredoxin subunit